MRQQWSYVFLALTHRCGVSAVTPTLLRHHDGCWCPDAKQAPGHQQQPCWFGCDQSAKRIVLCNTPPHCSRLSEIWSGKFAGSVVFWQNNVMRCGKRVCGYHMRGFLVQVWWHIFASVDWVAFGSITARCPLDANSFPGPGNADLSSVCPSARPSVI